MNREEAPDRTRPRRVLVVDDEPGIVAVMRRVLEGRGYEVATSSGGEHALSAAGSGAFDLVISDFAIPHLNGLEFAERLFRACPRAQVLIVSAFLDPENIDALLRAPNVRGLLRKPFDISDLLRRVDGFFGEPDGQERERPDRFEMPGPNGGAGPGDCFLDEGRFH